MAKEKITKNILIEELVDNHPFSVEYLAKKGIRCIVCGESVWGTLNEACAEKGFDVVTVEKFVKELNELEADFEKNLNEEISQINTGKLDV